MLPAIIHAQKQKETSNTSANSYYDVYAMKEKVFRAALKVNDLQVAKAALFEMLALKPENKSLKDSLAFIYINLGQAPQAILLAREILETDPNNQPILEVKALAEQSLGMSKEALTTYETLFPKSKNVYHLYQIATLQYELKRMAECNTTVDQILGTSEVEKKEVTMPTTVRGQQQNVSLKAAALNIKGVLAMDLNENAFAKAMLEEALKISPEFALAKNNLEVVNKKLQANNAPRQAPAPAKK